MVVYRLIRATLNEAEFFSPGLSKSHVQGGKGLTPFSIQIPEALPKDLDLKLTQCPSTPVIPDCSRL